jgi:hypothetical protein
VTAAAFTPFFVAETVPVEAVAFGATVTVPLPGFLPLADQESVSVAPL